MLPVLFLGALTGPAFVRRFLDRHVAVSICAAVVAVLLLAWRVRQAGHIATFLFTPADFEYYAIAATVLIAVSLGFVLATPLRAPWRRHAGLAAVCAALVVYALSTKVFLGHVLLFDLGDPGIFDQLRVSGRFFWPVAYLAAIGGIGVLARRLDRRLAAVLLVGAAAAQFADTSHLRAQVRDKYAAQTPWSVDAALLLRVLARSDHMTIWPVFGCGARVETPLFEQGVLLAIEAGVPVDTMRLSRRGPDAKCPPPETATRPLEPGEVRYFLPDGRPGDWQRIDGSAHACLPSGSIVVCASALAGVAGADLAGAAAHRIVPDLPAGRRLSVAVGQAGSPALDQGWSLEDWGSWSAGYTSDLLLRIDGEAERPLRLKLWASMFMPPWVDHRSVVVSVNGGYVGTLVLTRAEQEIALPIPAGATRTGLLQIAFDLAAAVSPNSLGMSADPRLLGIGLRAFELDEVPPP